MPQLHPPSTVQFFQNQFQTFSITEYKLGQDMDKPYHLPILDPVRHPILMDGFLGDFLIGGPSFGAPIDAKDFQTVHLKIDSRAIPYPEDQVHFPPIIDHVLQPKPDTPFMFGNNVLLFSVEQQLAEPIIMGCLSNQGFHFCLKFPCGSNP